MSLRTRSDDDERFHVFATRSTASLTRLAYLLCGDQHLANDLVQTCLIRVYQAWSRVRDKDAADAYARKVLLRCWLNERRRPWRRSESRDGVVPDQPAPVRDPAWWHTTRRCSVKRSRSSRRANAPRWCSVTGHSTP